MLENLMLELRGLNLMRNWREIISEYIKDNFFEMISSEPLASDYQKDGKQVVILGGGLSGLACAYKLLQKGIGVTLIEKEKEVGGLARTIRYKDFYFDFSAHRFLGKDKELIEEMKILMGDNFKKCSKRSRILMWGHWLNYPFELANLMIYMPKTLAARAVVDYLSSLVKRRFKPVEIVSFKDWFIASFGHTLYKTNCEPYAAKHWRRDPSQIASEWGEARSPANFNLKTIIKDLLFKKHASQLEEGNPYPDADSFYYPVRGGCGSIPRRFAEEIHNLGGRIITEAELIAVNNESGNSYIKYNRNGESVKIMADVIVSTIPVNNLVKILTPQAPQEVYDRLAQLKYLNTIFINVIINKPKVSDDSWLYFPQPSEEVLFVRAVEMKNWSEDLAPADKTGLCLDISCTPDEPIWQENNDRALVAKAREGLVKTGIISRPEEMEEGIVIKVPYTYPIYDLTYSENLKSVIDHLEDNGRLKLLGRTGRFSYTNMDDNVKDGFKLAEKIIFSQ